MSWGKLGALLVLVWLLPDVIELPGSITYVMEHGYDASFLWGSLGLGVLICGWCAHIITRKGEDQ